MSKSQPHRWIVTLSLLGLLLLPTGLFAQYTFKTFASPKNFTDLFIGGINNAGRMVATCYGGTVGTQGIVIYPTGYKALTFPNCKWVSPQGVNNRNEITGSLWSAKMTKAFVKYSNGTLKVYMAKGSIETVGRGSNDFGVKSGHFRDALGIYHGYTLTQSGKFTTIDFPGSQETIVYGINNGGELVGYFSDDAGIGHGFLLSNGNFTIMDYPGADFTGAYAINNKGEIVGVYSSGPDFLSHSFHYYQGAFQPIEIPGDEIASYASGINDSGVVVGTYYTDRDYGYVATPVPAD